MRSYEKIKPAIFIYYDDCDTVQIPLKKIKEGLEEENVPWEERQERGNVYELAKKAAVDSRLGIGIGLLSDGACILQHKRMPRGRWIMEILSGASTGEAYRILGSNAARLAKNMPLKWPGGGRE